MGFALALSLAGVAYADGVVLSSTSPDYDRGDIIESGTRIDLAPGERLELLRASGKTEVLTHSLILDADTLKAEAQIPSEDEAATQLAFWDHRRSDVGGTRTGDLEDCLDRAERGDSITRAQCLAAFSEAEAPSLAVKLALRSASVPSETRLLLSVRASFDAYVGCEMTGDGDKADSSQLSLSHRADGWLRVRKNVDAMAPQKGGPEFRAPALAGDYQLRCTAISLETVSAVSDTAKYGSDLPVLAGFATLRGDATATSSLVLKVR